MVYKNDLNSFTITNSVTENWKSSGINNISQQVDVKNSAEKLPATITPSGVKFANTYFKQTKIDYIRINVIKKLII